MSGLLREASTSAEAYFNVRFKSNTFSQPKNYSQTLSSVIIELRM
jgi:hypothetical protein